MIVSQCVIADAGCDVGIAIKSSTPGLSKSCCVPTIFRLGSAQVVEDRWRGREFWLRASVMLVGWRAWKSRGVLLTCVVSADGLHIGGSGLALEDIGGYLCVYDTWLRLYTI
jgi:hypothetical protein